MMSETDYEMCLSVATNILRKQGLVDKNLEHGAQDVAVRIFERNPEYITPGYVKLYCKEYIKTQVVYINEHEDTECDLKHRLCRNTEGEDTDNEVLDMVRPYVLPKYERAWDLCNLLKKVFPNEFHAVIDRSLLDITEDFKNGSLFSSLSKHLAVSRKRISRYIDAAYYDDELRKLYECETKKSLNF